MANYNISPEDIDTCISRLDYEIEYMNEEIEREEKEWENEYSTSMTSQVEKTTFLDHLNQLSGAVRVLEEMRNVIARAQETIDSSVGFKSNGEDFIFQEEEADAAIHELKELFANDNLSGAMKFSSNYEDFCGSMKVQKNADKLAVTNHKKKQNDNDAFDYNSKQMEDMLVEIQKLNTKIGEKFNEVYLKYETIFGNLRGTELMDDILREFDLDLDLKDIIATKDTPLPNNVESLYPILDEFSNLLNLTDLTPGEIQKYLNEIINRMKDMFPDMNQRELFDLFLYLVATVRYSGLLWSATWGGYDEAHSGQLDELQNEEWYKNLKNILKDNHDNAEVIDWVHFAANLLTLETSTYPLDGIVNELSGWRGDKVKDGEDVSDSDLNSDYLALLVEKDLNAGISPIESIETHYKELKANPIEDWDEFDERLASEGIDV